MTSSTLMSFGVTKMLSSVGPVALSSAWTMAHVSCCIGVRAGSRTVACVVGVLGEAAAVAEGVSAGAEGGWSAVEGKLVRARAGGGVVAAVWGVVGGVAWS